VRALDQPGRAGVVGEAQPQACVPAGGKWSGA
jgi:hypothetical protein